MPNYNFTDLSPIDFEDLSRDLLQKHLGVFLESFKAGKDQGIDLRYSSDVENSIIIQCKRYSSIKDLKRELKKEVKKVEKLLPKRYIIVTSVDLTPKQKKDIKNIFNGIKLYLKDILGKKDINNLLGKFSEIEKNHYKLWLNSTTVLERILHNSIYNRSDFEKEEIEREIKIYVSNDSNKEATEILNKFNYVIISGIPGIGKTTLARMLLYNFLIEDWEIIAVSSDIKEAEDTFKPDKHQVFYYDDFLGTNFLSELISKNEDKRIIKFIERVKKSRNKKLILTTREYILNQATEKFELFQDQALEIAKCTIDLKKYKKLIKGKILFNHLFYSDLKYAYINEIIRENRFLNIVKHPNYNPRLIQYLTDKKFLNDTSPDNYYNFFIENLANPQHIWNYAFNSHISPISRYLLLVFLTLEEPVLREDLYKALISFSEKNIKRYGFSINKIEFERSLKECERTFILMEKDIKNQVIIRYQNPSIKDYLISYLNNQNELVKNLINAASFFNQFTNIFSNNKNDKKVFIDDSIIRVLFSNVKKTFYSTNVSTLKQDFDFEKFEFFWVRGGLTKVERLNKFAQLISLSASKDIFDFIQKEFEKIDLDSEINGNHEIRNYLTLAEKINEQQELDGLIIIEKIFSKEKIQSFAEINEVSNLKFIFPDEYEKFEQNINGQYEVIENVLTSEFGRLENNFDREKISEFLDELTQIHEDFDFDTQHYVVKAMDLMSELEDESDEEKKETKKLPISFIQNNEDDQILINIFDSLKMKENQ